jgi:hypothetical protein
MLFLYHLIPFLTSFPNPSDNEHTHTHTYIYIYIYIYRCFLRGSHSLGTSFKSNCSLWQTKNLGNQLTSVQSHETFRKANHMGLGPLDVKCIWVRSFPYKLLSNISKKIMPTKPTAEVNRLVHAGRRDWTQKLSSKSIVHRRVVLYPTIPDNFV